MLMRLNLQMQQHIDQLLHTMHMRPLWGLYGDVTTALPCSMERAQELMDKGMQQQLAAMADPIYLMLRITGITMVSRNIKGRASAATVIAAIIQLLPVRPRACHAAAATAAAAVHAANVLRAGMCKSSNS